MPKELSDLEKKWILEDTFQVVRIDQTLDKVGMTRREFNEYLKANQEFKAEYDQALIDSCTFIENDILNAHNAKTPAKAGPQSKKPSPAGAALFSQNAMKILAARRPDKYGNKLDLNMNQTVSIRHNIEAANERVARLMRDVTVTAVIDVRKEEEESPKPE
jgi:hypothetical protein